MTRGVAAAVGGDGDTADATGAAGIDRAGCALRRRGRRDGWIFLATFIALNAWAPGAFAQNVESSPLGGNLFKESDDLGWVIETHQPGVGNAFTTGGIATGYQVMQVRMWVLLGVDVDEMGLVVALHKADSGKPTDTVAYFTRSNGFREGWNAMIPAEPIYLEPDSDYALVDQALWMQVWGGFDDRPYVVDGGVAVTSTPPYTGAGDTYGLGETIEATVNSLPDTRLAELSIDPGVLVPAFDPDVREYGIAYANSVVRATVSARTRTAISRILPEDAAADEDDTTVGVTFELAEASASPVTFDWSTADGTATAGADYAAASGTVTIAAGQTTATVTVSILDDNADEADETFDVTVSNLVGAEAADTTAEVVIRDDDEVGGLFSTTKLTVPEGGSATYELSLTAQPTVTVTARPLRTGSGDVTVTPPSLTFTRLNWATAQTVTVAAAEDDDAVADTAEISHPLNGSGYLVVLDTVSVAVEENDAVGVSGIPATLNVREGGSGLGGGDGDGG